MTILLPFNEAGQWLRGSLHCHSTNSDGEVPPEQVAARYKAEGYDFICVTDHFRPEFNYPITDLSVFNLQVVKRSLKAQKRSRHF
ncbi:MAG: PHP domain-containing protein, partial [Sutterella wadsworthensis]